MANTNEIADIDGLKKVFDSLDTTLNKTAASYLTLVKSFEAGSKAMKEATVTTENVTKAKKETAAATEKLDALDKQLAGQEAKLKQLEDERMKTIIANRIAIQEKTKAVNDAVKAAGAEEGSLVRMRQKLSELTAQYDKAGTRTKEAAKEIDALSREIGKAEAATNRHQRGVGGYADQLGHLSGQLSNLPGPIGEAASGFEGLLSKVKAFGPWGALIAGGLLALSAPLIAFFTKSEEGMDKMEQKVAGVKAAFAVLTGELIKGGRAMVDMVDAPDEKVSVFYTRLLTFVAGASPKIVALGARMDMASSIAQGVVKEQQKLEDKENSMIVTRAKASDQIKQARLIYAQANLPIQERISALAKALELEGKTAEVEIKHQTEVVDQLQIIKTEKLKVGQWLRSDEKSLQEAMAKTIELSSESAGRQMRATNTLKKARKEMAAEEKSNNDESAAAAKITADKKIKEEERLSYSKTGLAKMVGNETKVIEDDGLKSNQNFLDAKLKQAEKEAADEKKLQEDLKKAKIDMAFAAGNAIFEFNGMALTKQLNQLQVEKDTKLANAKLTTEQRAKIEAEYTKKQNEIKAKQAKNDKLQALFNIAINTAVAISKASPKIPLMIFAAVAGALQAALVAAQPIPKYARGTQSAERAGIFGEAGRELMSLRSGELMMADKATYFEGSKFKGAKIYSNPETERMMSMVADRNIIVRNQTDDRLLDQMKKVERAILNKPVAIYDQNHRQIGVGNSTHQEIYLNRLIR